MNILIPHKWLQDHLQTKAKPKEIQEYLSLSGPSVERIEEVDGDRVYDVEVTTNRIDSMSVRGIAREAAVILERYDFKSELKPLQLKKDAKLQADAKPLPKINNNEQLCNRILCVVLADVQHTPTPKWMAQRLKQVGMKVHDSVIDITNYITHDLGHPCHAFDYDKIMELGGIINVTTAKAGKPFVTLDNQEYETVGGEIVFTNDVGTIIDLPAIIGTKNSSVDENSKNILLWIEDLDPQKVRQASMQHAIRTVAAQLNEKNVDPHLGQPTLLKAIQLYQDVTKAKIASEIYDDFPGTRQLEPVQIQQDTIKNYLGLTVNTERVEEILTKLGCQVEIEPDTQDHGLSYTIQPPTFRPDLKIPADIVEEIARIYGYQELPSQLMATKLPVNYPKKSDFQLEDRIKYFLSDISWQEVYTYSLVSETLAQQSEYQLQEHLKLLNPLTTDKVYLRRSLMPSLAAAVDSNPNQEQLSVFELAQIYHPRDNKIPEQKMKLGMLSHKPYRKMRGDLEALLNQFYINDITVEPVALDDDSVYLQQGKLMVIEDKQQHDLGCVYVLPQNQVGAELDLETLVSLAKKYPNYQPQLKTTPIIEDLTFTLKPNTLAGQVMTTIKNVSPLVTAVKLKDIYQQNHTFTIHYQHNQQNLTNEDVTPIREKIVKTVEDKFGVNLVGSI